MSQLQSLHLYIQALVLTELDLDSPTYYSGPVCFAPHAQWSPSLSPHLGLEVLPLYPGNPVLTLPFPEHPTLLAKTALDLRPRASGWHGGSTDLVCCLGICNPEDKLEGLLLGSSFLLSVKVHAWSLLFLGPKAPKASTGPRLGPTVRVMPGTIVVPDLK